MGKKWNQWQILFSWAPKSMQMVNAAMKLKDVPWKKSYDKPRQLIKKQKRHFAVKSLYSQSYGFSSSYVWMWELNHKEYWVSGEFPWTRSLVGYSPWGHKELDTTEWLTLFLSLLWLTVFQQMCQSNPTEKLKSLKINGAGATGYLYKKIIFMLTLTPHTLCKS